MRFEIGLAAAGLALLPLALKAHHSRGILGGDPETLAGSDRPIHDKYANDRNEVDGDPFTIEPSTR